MELEWLTALTQFITEIGFPIACVVVLFYLWDKERTAHEEETKLFVEALNKNTSILEQIKERLMK